MKKRIWMVPLAAALCALLLTSAPRTALLAPAAAEPEISIDEENIPLAETPEATQEEDPFAQFTEDQRAVMEEVLELVNKARSQAGLSPLELDPALCGAAQVRAEECVGTFSHTRPNGSSYQTAVSEAGLDSSYVGENVATGYKNAQHVMDGWLKSEGHRANILNENYTRMGLGFEKNTGNRYQGFAWAQLFVQ